MTNEVLVSYSRLTLDNHFKDPEPARAGRRRHQLPGHLPAGQTSPYLPTDLLHGWGSSGQVGNLWAKANDMYAHNDALQFSDKLTKLARDARHEVRRSRSSAARSSRTSRTSRPASCGSAPTTTTGTGNSGADMLVGRVGQFNQGTARNGNPAPGQPFGEFRYWNIDAFAQDSWKLRSNLTLEYGVRFGYWTNNRELSGLGGYFTPYALRPDQGLVPRPGHLPAAERRLLRLHRLRARRRPRRTASRSRCRASTSRGTSTARATTSLRGGYGMFYNRNMGNVEYDNTLRLRAERLSGRHRLLGRRRLRQRPRPDLRHGSRGDARQPHRQHRHQLADARLVQVPEDAQLQHVVRAAHSVEPGGRGELRRHPRPRPGEPQQRQRHAIRRAEHRHLQRRRPVVPGQPLCGRQRRRRNLAAFRPFNALAAMTLYDFRGESNYDSMQVTLSRQTGRRLQYFVAYTLRPRPKGTLGGEYSVIDPYDPKRTYGVLNEDRTHILNVSWNAFLPDGAKGAMDNAFGRGLLNGWQLSGISSMASGIPMRLSFCGRGGVGRHVGRLFRHRRRRRAEQWRRQRSGAHLHVRSAARRQRRRREDPRHQLHRRPGVRQERRSRAAVQHPHADTDQPRPDAVQELRDQGDQKLQFRVGFFNLFNQAFATTAVDGGDINLMLDTTCACA